MCYTSLHFRDCNIHTISQLFFLRKYFTAEYLKNYNKNKGSAGVRRVKRRKDLWQGIVTRKEPHPFCPAGPVPCQVRICHTKEVIHETI